MVAQTEHVFCPTHNSFAIVRLAPTTAAYPLPSPLCRNLERWFRQSFRSVENQYFITILLITITFQTDKVRGFIRFGHR